MNKELNCIGCGEPGCDGKAGCDWYDRKIENRAKHIEAIRDACIKANPDLLELKYGLSDGVKIDDPRAKETKLKREIRLADALVAIEKRSDLWLTPDGWFAKYAGNGQLTHVAQWNLREDDLTKQSEECIKFLSELLAN